MNVLPTVCLLWVAGLVFTGSVAHAAGFDELKSAVTEGKTQFNFRYRYEFVDQDGIDREAGASTLRGRLTWTSGLINNWQFRTEADYVALVGSERYNSTENGRGAYPVVPDPEGFDLNQAFIKYESENFVATFGRQRNLQADQRFVGGVGWRQNEQTYDAVRAEYDVGEHVSIDYSYVWNVNRIFGPNDGAQPSDWRSNAHFLLATFDVAEHHELEGFAYLLDFENDNGLPNSTATYGLTYSGTLGPLKLTGTYARQSDYADSPLDYDANYYAFSAAAKIDLATLTVGYEVLGSDNARAAFRTPLATLHKWQGWADKFLNTPAEGIEDLYFGLSGSLGPVKVAATYHDFSADEGNLNYGAEIDLVMDYTIRNGINAQLKFADYRADDFATDTKKVWFSLIVAL